MIVISAGAKAILDLPKTLEMMETLGITVVGYKTNEFPAFYSQSSGCFGVHPVSSSHGVAALFRENISVGLSASVLVANPVPLKDEIPAQEIESIINASCKTAAKQNITGKENRILQEKI